MYSCLAIDDDPLFLRLLETYFSDIEKAELLGAFTNPVQGALAIVKLKPQVVLLDYEMPYLDGFEMLSMIPDKPKVVVISGFLTSLDKAKVPTDLFLHKSDLDGPQKLEKVILEAMEKTA